MNLNYGFPKRFRLRKNLILFMVWVSVSEISFAQEYFSQTDKLATTAKVWGFLKYYHPNVANGKIDWDKQLIERLPSIEEAKTSEDLSLIYLHWLESLGDIKLCKNCQERPSSIYFDQSFDLSWLENQNVFTQELSDKFKLIHQNRYQGKPYYVSTEGRNSDLVISNEKSYNDFDWRNSQLRLLAFFRYWNIIEYFYPHKYQLDEDWDSVLYEMLSKFLSAETELDYHLSMLELVVKIDDSHGYFTTDLINSHFGLNLIPAAFKIIDDKMVITALYDKNLASANDLQVGDVIAKVEGVDVSQILRENYKYINGANLGVKSKYAFGKILNGSADSVEVELIRGENKYVRKLAKYPRDKFNAQSESTSWELIQDNIGYINLKNIDGKQLSIALQRLENTKAIIIDLRNYPKEFFGNQFKNFLGARSEVVTKRIKPDFKYPGRYLVSDQKGKTKASKYAGKVILLADEYTQSRAEFTALHIQNGYNVTTIGSQTAGAGGVMIPMDFIGGFTTYFTSSGIFYPDMSPIQRNGVRVDIEVKPTIEGIIAGKDEVLEKALELLESPKLELN